MAHNIITDQASGDKVCIVCGKRNENLKRPVLEDSTCTGDTNYNPSETSDSILMF